MFTQSINFFFSIAYFPRIKEYRCLKNLIHQIDRKRTIASFSAKFQLAFALTQENAFSERFHFKVNRKSIGSSKKRY